MSGHLAWIEKLRCECCGPYYRLQDCDCVAVNYWIIASAVSVGNELTYDGNCYRVSATTSATVPSGHMNVPPGEITIGKCCTWYIPVYKCYGDCGLLGYVAETVTPGRYKYDGSCVRVNPSSVAAAHVCPASRLDAGLLVSDTECCAMEFQIDVSGVDAGLCPTCCAAFGNQKWYNVDVDGTYFRTIIADELCLGGADVDLPYESMGMGQGWGSGCSGSPTTIVRPSATCKISIAYNPQTMRLTSVGITGTQSGVGLPASFRVFDWSGDAAFGDTLPNQIATCTCNGFADTEWKGSTTGTITVSILDS